jgi:hypothetical protein
MNCVAIPAIAKTVGSIALVVTLAYLERVKRARTSAPNQVRRRQDLAVPAA